MIPPKPNVDLIIPALNEEEALFRLFDHIPRDIVRSIIVVDNGSTDDTSQVARSKGAIVLSEPKKGYGRACLTGLNYLEKDPPGIVAFMDGDYSDDPKELPKLIDPIITDGYDLVLGSRIKGNREKDALPPHSILANKLFALIVNLIYGLDLSDLGSFKAIRYHDIKDLEISDEGYGFPIELIVKSAKKKLKVLEVPLSFRKRVGVSKVTGNPVASMKAGAKILYVIGKHSLKKHD